ncbi:unnamed protein product [Didymodactylos carnosus]|nr:unnamed protein product [Didymodactylos carnosus]CAF4263792.1 unnamed protein product [Didymodactylos carnosus]
MMNEIARDISIHCNDLVQLIIFRPNDKETSTRDMNNRTQSKYKCLELILRVLARIPYSDVQKENLVRSCIERYNNNAIQCHNLKLFGQQYSSATDSLKWYTRESPLYKLLNEGLRKDNIDEILGFGFFIAHLEQQLSDLHQTYISSLSSNRTAVLIAYRGQHLNGLELNRLKQSINGQISFQSFISTSLNRNAALIYAGDGSRRKAPEFMESVLFEIEIDLMNESNQHRMFAKPFARIDHMSPFGDEEEILFTIGTVFEIKSIEQDTDNFIWDVKLKIVDNDDEQPMFIEKVEYYLNRISLSMTPENRNKSLSMAF